jgi:hypothetical protein
MRKVLLSLLLVVSLYSCSNESGYFKVKDYDIFRREVVQPKDNVVEVEFFKFMHINDDLFCTVYTREINGCYKVDTINEYINGEFITLLLFNENKCVIKNKTLFFNGRSFSYAK